MKKILLVLLTVTFGLLSGCSEKEDESGILKEPETSLYDKDKEAVAYIDNEDADKTIYTWDGIPVAYFTSEKDVYRFDGSFLGWYVDGILYDIDGYAVAAIEGVVNGEIIMTALRIESVKGIKYIKPVKHVRSVKPADPVFRNNWSETILTDYLLPSDPLSHL